MQILWTETQIRDRVQALAAELRADAGDEEILLVGVLKGTAVFLADLLRAIPGPVGYEFLDKISDLSDTSIADAIEIDFLSHFDMRGRRVYLLKDVVSTGVIEQWLMSQLRLRHPSAIKLVALIDRPDLRRTAFDVDYRAFVGGSGQFVGYGLEADGRGANLTSIGSRSLHGSADAPPVTT